MAVTKLTKRRANNFIKKFQKEIIEKDYQTIFNYLNKTDTSAIGRPNYIAEYTQLLLDAKVDFLSYMTTIVGRMFFNTDISSLIIPSNIEVIHDNAFHNCKNLKSITIEEGCKKLGSRIFSDCNKLAEINLPASVTSISADTFAFSNLNTILINNINTLGRLLESRFSHYAPDSMSILVNVNLLTSQVLDNYSFSEEVESHPGYVECLGKL